MKRLFTLALLWFAGFSQPGLAGEREEIWKRIEPYFKPPVEFADQAAAGASPLKFYDGKPVKTRADWAKRRQEILDYWTGVMGPWPPLLAKPKVEYVEKQARDNLIQQRVRVEVSAGVMQEGYLLIPEGKGPFPAVFVPFYDPETSIGLKGEQRDFAYQLARRGFVALAIGSPGGDARKPELSGAKCQPLSYLAYISANCHAVLANLPEVDAGRIGIVGHSYGSKWSMFSSCLYDKYACAVWSDGGIAFDEKRPSINYWEPWYLGLDSGHYHKPGLVTAENPRTGAYKKLIEGGHELVELEALMAPRPVLVSGGSEDYRARWPVLNHLIAVNRLLGYSNRVAMTNRPEHPPTAESNAVVYDFFEYFLKYPDTGAKRRQE